MVMRIGEGGGVRPTTEKLDRLEGQVEGDVKDPRGADPNPLPHSVWPLVGLTPPREVLGLCGDVHRIVLRCTLWNRFEPTISVSSIWSPDRREFSVAG